MLNPLNHASVSSWPNERLTTEQAADYLGITAPTLRTWRCRKTQYIPVTKVGRKVFYRRSDLDKFLEANTDAAL